MLDPNGNLVESYTRSLVDRSKIASLNYDWKEMQLNWIIEYAYRLVEISGGSLIDKTTDQEEEYSFDQLTTPFSEIDRFGKTPPKDRTFDQRSYKNFQATIQYSSITLTNQQL